MVWKSKYLLVSTIRIITLIIISIHFFSLFIYLFIYCFFFSNRVPSNLFQKLLIRIFEKRKNLELQLGYLLEPGRLFSFHRNWRRVAVYNSWDSKGGTWNTSAWHIGLVRKDGVWIWQTGQQLNISKWRDSKQDGKKNRAEISKNEGLFNSISGSDENAFICEIPGGKIIFPPLSLLVWVITCFRVQFGINKHE